MMRYVALLRGINVGGNNKIDMKALKCTFENAGMTDVTTYINTGNILFTDPARSLPEITAVLEQAIETDYSLKIKVLVLSEEAYCRIAKAIPAHWVNDKQMKSDVMFLWEDFNSEAVLEQVIIKPDIDTVIYVPGAILWSVDRSRPGTSGMEKLIGTKIYRHITVRNVNTTRKIDELLQSSRRD